MTYQIFTLSPAESPSLADMTFPAYRHLLSRRSVIATGLACGSEPLGLALCAPGADRKTMELLSLYVEPAHRRSGHGTALLRCLEASAAHRWWGEVRTTWNDAMAGAAPFARVLEKRGWSEPQQRQLILRADMAGRFGRWMQEEETKYASPACLPRSYTLKAWADMTPQDHAFIRERQGTPGWHAANEDPYREERILDPSLSRLLLKDEAIAGWLTVHRTAPDTARFTDVFIREDLKRAGAVAVIMVIHGFWLLIKAGVPNMTWAIWKDNSPLADMCIKRLAPHADLNHTWGAAKRLRK